MYKTIIIFSIFLTFFIPTALVKASPSETNYFYINFKGAEAENFKNQQTKESSRNYGQNNSNIMYDYVYFYTLHKDDEDKAFDFEISCQQRVENYLTENPKPLAPTCTFVYFNKIMHTNIDMTPKISEKMIKSLKWTQFPGRDSSYFGCFDNRDSGCPNIRFYPATAQSEAEIDISFFKP